MPSSSRISPGALAIDDPQPPRIGAGCEGDLRWWRVGGDRVELSPGPSGWTARVWRADWGGTPLDLGGHFAGEAEALAWCRRMAEVLARDLADEGDGPIG
jgi:hypothetical protein